ncbi:hypothetical protein [Thermosipho globiformans]|uniref:hypothetical protein n=1 Tax=Thermosipho globiformans TaxID=380685 RepID=UPI000F8E66FB|nr:hypothetical protein [Thermosipho globiformans]
MVFSAQKPARIVILSTRDDINNGTVTVKYAFRFGITEATHTETAYNEETGKPIEQTINGWQYEEIIKEQTFPLLHKPIIPQILELYYQAEIPPLEQNLKLARIEIPKEIE